MKKSNSYLLHKGIIDGESYLIIATMKSDNSKTGNMVQVCILLEDTDPVAGVLSGLDARTICQGCPFASGEGCYVNVGQSPLAIWRAYHRGNVPYLRAKDYPLHFSGRKVRFGSYGNPTLIPRHIVRYIASICDGWTVISTTGENSEKQRLGFGIDTLWPRLRLLSHCYLPKNGALGFFMLRL